MKKTIISIAAAALCASALSVTAFAEDVLTDRSIYLAAHGSSMPSVKRWVVDGEAIVPDMNTIMPFYIMDIDDYAKTGNFEIGSTPQYYIADSNDDYGNFTGIMHLKLIDGVLVPIYQEIANENTESIAFEANAKRVSALMKKRGLNTDCKEVKLIFMERVGYGYYIDNGEEKVLVAANITEVNSRIFGEGIVVIGDELKAAAEAELEAYNTYLEECQKILDSLGIGPDDPALGMSGYSAPMYKVDNTPYLDTAEDRPAPASSETSPATAESEPPAIIDVTNTPPVQENNNETEPEGTNPALVGGIALAGGIAFTACVIGISAAKKKKKQ